MKKIKVLRNFSIENQVFIKDSEIIVNDDFAGSPRYYDVISSTADDKPKKGAKRGSKGKRIPNRKVKSRNTAITNKDKE